MAEYAAYFTDGSSRMIEVDVAGFSRRSAYAVWRAIQAAEATGKTVSKISLPTFVTPKDGIPRPVDLYVWSRAEIAYIMARESP